MSALTPRFWAGPIRYCRYAAREHPAYFWSVVIAGLMPVTFIVAPPIRRALGDEDPVPVPMTYPGALSCPVATRPSQPLFPTRFLVKWSAMCRGRAVPSRLAN